MKLDTKSQAARWGIQPKTLENWRWQGKGPPHYKIGGRVMYDVDETDAWLAAQRRISTRDTGPTEQSAA